MSGPPPPPPPPHGENPRTTSSSENLPPGKYDIFIIPPHSSGSGFLYLPSLKPNINSFIAGFASAIVLVVLLQSMAPAFKAWWSNFQGMGNMGMFLLVIAVGLGAWALGRTQNEGGSGPNNGARGANGGDGTYGAQAGAGPHANGHAAGGSAPPPPPHSSDPPPQPGPMPGGPGGGEKSWQRPAEPQTPPKSPPPPKSTWERAREEARKREEERKAQEAEQKRKEDIAKKLRDLREKDARERAKRDQEAKDKAAKEAEAKEQREKEQREKEAKERAAKEREQRETRMRENRERELRERLEREKTLREKLEREAKEREASRLSEDAARKSTYAYSSVGEKTNPWPNGRPPSQPASPAKPNPNPTSAKRPPAATAQSFTGTDEDAYSYRPYDQPKQHSRRRSGETIFTQSSYAPSHSTARSTPPPSFRAPYSTKDPDKIVIKGVYSFMNQFAKTPASQLISGVAPMTDGLILRITTEGVFIDDDVRGVPQREWDVKAWTLKLMEVWCCSRSFAANTPSAGGPKVQKGHRFRTDRGQPKTLNGDEAETFLNEMLRTCKNECRLGPHGDQSSADLDGQPGEWRQRGLHILRASINDQEGKRYLFVIGEEEGWKLAASLQCLKKGKQARQMGLQAMTAVEARNTLEMLGWT